MDIESAPTIFIADIRSKNNYELRIKITRLSEDREDREDRSVRIACRG